MSDRHAENKARRGTKSCTECRRRKIRCIRKSDDSEVCRSCEDRGTACVAQTFSSRPHRTDRLPSKIRIGQLESEVAQLKKIVFGILPKIGQSSPDVLSSADIPQTSDIDSDDYNDDMSVSDVPAAEQPSHLRSLFQNELFSVESGHEDQQPQNPKAKLSPHLLNIARDALQKLIPTKDDLVEMTKSDNAFFDTLLDMLPPSLTIRSKHEMMESYDHLQRPDADAMELASWLLDIAIVAIQYPQQNASPATRFKGFQSVMTFSRAVSDVVDRTLIFYDRLLGSLEGLEMAVHFLRLQVSMANTQRTWLLMRRLIAIAEIIGIPKASRAVQLNKLAGLSIDKTQMAKAEVWEFLCSVERMYGMFLNLPSVSRRFRLSAPPLIKDGRVQEFIYLGRLADISVRIQQLEEAVSLEGSESDLPTTIIELDREIQSLAAQVPRSWWDEYLQYSKPEHIVQCFHHYITMRLHLPLALRNNAGEDYSYSKHACISACESVARRYQYLRRALPPGFFLCRALDLQVLTATIVLLLMSNSGQAQDHPNWETNNSRTAGIVSHVVALMDEKAHETAGPSFAKHGMVAIRSLVALLRQDSNSPGETDLKLTVPLLGNISVRRNAYPSQTRTQSQPQTYQNPSEPGLWRPNVQQSLLQDPGNAPLDPGNLWETTTQPQGDWQWNPLSWSIEDAQDNLFQAAFMDEDMDQYAMWQADQSNLSVYG